MWLQEKREMELVNLDEMALPLQTLAGWVFQPPLKHEGRTLLCKSCEMRAKCQTLVLAGNPILCERILKRELVPL